MRGRQKLRCVIALIVTYNDWKNSGEKSNKMKELETADRERNQRNVRRRNKTMEKEIIVNS